MTGKGKTYPAAPNAYEAVTTSLPVLNSVLLGFLGAYFVGVSIAENENLSLKQQLYPLLVIDRLSFTSPFTRKELISTACFASAVLFLFSMLRAVAAQMLHCDKDLASTTDSDEREVVTQWKEGCESATRNAVTAFHFAIPTLLLTFVLVLNGTFLSIGLYGVFGWYVHNAVSWFRDA